MESKSNRRHEEFQSNFIQISRTINTGISYLPLPEPKFSVIQPRQSIDVKRQIEEDFSMRFRYFNEQDFNEFFHSESTKFDRYKIIYQRLYDNVLQSLHHCVDLNDEFTRLNHQLTYQNELFPILIQNHHFAKQEEKILNDYASKCWQRFNQRLENEIQVQNHYEQLQQQHQSLMKKKIEQEFHHTLSLKLNTIQNDILQLREEIQSYEVYKNQLKEQLVSIRTQRSYYFNRLDFLRSHFIRNYTVELNHLQIERHSLITQTELMKYNHFEQIQQIDSILHRYRIGLDDFRSTIDELEEQLRRLTDDGFQSFQLDLIDFLSQTGFSSISTLNSKGSIDQRRSTIHDDSQRLISILENQIDENFLKKSDLEKLIEEFEKKIVEQTKLIEKKQEDYASMNKIEKKLNRAINMCRENSSRLKTERRHIETYSHSLIKQVNDDDRLTRNLQQQHDSFLLRKRIEEQRFNGLIQRLQPLIEENENLKIFNGQLQHRIDDIHRPTLVQLQEKLVRLRQTHEKHLQDRFVFESTRKNYQNIDEQWKLKTSRINVRLSNVLQRMKTNDRIHQENTIEIHHLEIQLSTHQHRYLQWTFQLTTTKNRLETQKNHRHQIETQIQMKENFIKHNQQRLKSFDEQLIICHSDLVEQNVSLKKLREFHSVLNEQSELNMRKLSNGHFHLIHLQYRYTSLEKNLQDLNEQMNKSIHQREILTRMLIRRTNLCQLLYRTLSRIEKQNHQRQNYLERLTKCIRSSIEQIRNRRNQNEKLIRQREREQLKVIRAHFDKIHSYSNEKQIVLTEEIFRQRFLAIHPHPSTTEDFHQLKNKYELLKKRLIKMIYRGILCHLVFVSIQKDFIDYLNQYKSETNRNHRRDLNVVRTNFYRLIKRLKAKTAETNMLIDYRSYFQLIHTDILRQLTEWTNFIEPKNDV